MMAKKLTFLVQGLLSLELGQYCQFRHVFFNKYASNIYRRELLDICTRREFDPTARRLDIPLGHC